MKELDVMLEAFLAHNKAALSAGDWPELEALLNSEDDQLWDWLQGRAESPDVELRGVVDAIRRGSRSAPDPQHGYFE
jgi:succinate dehydrogenase flavin-adding protein (antitoxin of CptAB toxin-antitoxin module)